MQNRLLKSLSEIAAKELKITKGVNPQWKDKAELLVIAYGQDKIEKDFEDWIESVREEKPNNPVTDYLKLVDERLGDAPTVAEDDPRITVLIAEGYKTSGRPPSKTDVQKLLDGCCLEEIQAAWSEYVNQLDSGELKYAVKNFYRDGGGKGIILARRQIKDDLVRKDFEMQKSQETGQAESLERLSQIRKDLEEQDEAIQRISENPSALFGAS